MLSESAQHLFLVMVLGIVSTVGVLFTFALPSPSHSHKAQSALFARMMLFFVWVSYLCFALRFMFDEIFYLVPYSTFLLISAYMLLLTLVKRYGHGISFQGSVLIGAHLIAFVSITTFLTLTMPNSVWRELILICSLLVPVLLTIHCIKAYLKRRNTGDFVLLFIMVLTLITLVFVAPAYVTGVVSLPAHQTVVVFVVYLVVTMSFMLGFTVSVLHSLVIRLRLQAYTDPLTGAKNRHFFYEMAPKLAALAKRNAQELSVVVCDIDHFKNVNDKFGHVAGDKALKAFSRFIEQSMRAEDTLIRLGGEEFLILSPNCCIRQAQQLAERLREDVSQRVIKYNDAEFSITASFGVVELPKGTLDIFQTIKEADHALYQAKSQGRNRVIAFGA